MGFGLFGKLPQKRDFVSHGVPSNVLHPWETWLQHAVAASRSAMGTQWQDFYLVAPIWHFWLGSGMFGKPVMGSLMASVDQVGRYFPLTLFYVGEEGETFDPPTMGLDEEWFAALDARLLTVLGEDASADPTTLLQDLPTPTAAPATAESPGLGTGGSLLHEGEELEAGDLVTRDYRDAVVTRSYWWCAAAGAAPAEMTSWSGLPGPYYFSRMLRFLPPAAEESPL